MIESATTVANGTTLSADLCILGAGAAGIALARTFVGTKHQVLVLEGGGLEPSAASTDLYAGRNRGHAYHDLNACRTRFFGGSTNCWGGMCRPLEAFDLEERAWVPHSGWPFDLAHLRPFYERAQEVVGLGEARYDAEAWTGRGRQPFPFAGGAPLVSEVFQFCRERRRFGDVYKDELAAAANVRVLTDANVTRIGLAPHGRSVQQLDVKTLEGPSFTVKARRFVLATGGIENARLLLASRDVAKQGVGNDRDLVGRFFMEHPHTDHEGYLAAGPRLPQTSFYKREEVERGGRETRVWGLFRPTREALEKAGILNFGCVLFPQKPGGKVGKRHPLAPAVAHAAGDVDAAAWEPASRDEVLYFSFGTPTEQAPNPDSRVLLSDDKDALGVPRADLDWRLGELDKRTLRVAHELLAETFLRAGLGRVKLTVSGDAEPFPRQMFGGRHHIGTTRMHPDPARGVVDARCFVHGIDNLAVAGSSVFPTSGAANPTLTLIALALRLADQLHQDLA